MSINSDLDLQSVNMTSLILCASADQFLCLFVLLLPQKLIWLSWFQEPWYPMLLSFFEPLQTFCCLRQSFSSLMPPTIVTVQLVQTEAFACQYLQTVLHQTSVLNRTLFSDQLMILPKDFQPTCHCWCWIHSQQLHCHGIGWGSTWWLATMQ